MPISLPHNGSIRVTPEQARVVLRNLMDKKVNRVNPHQCGRAVEKKADLGPWKAPLIGAGIGAGLGGLTANRKKRGIGMMAGAGLGLIGGQMYNRPPVAPKAPTGLGANSTIPAADPSNYGADKSGVMELGLNHTLLPSAQFADPHMNTMRLGTHIPGVRPAASGLANLPGIRQLLNAGSKLVSKIPAVPGTAGMNAAGKALNTVGGKLGLATAATPGAVTKTLGAAAKPFGAAATVVGTALNTADAGYKGEQAIYDKAHEDPKSLGNFGGKGTGQYIKDLGTLTRTGYAADNQDLHRENRSGNWHTNYLSDIWSNIGKPVTSGINLVDNLINIPRTVGSNLIDGDASVLRGNKIIAQMNQGAEQVPAGYTGPRQLKLVLTIPDGKTSTGGTVIHGGYRYLDPATGQHYGPDDPIMREYRRVILGQDV